MEGRREEGGGRPCNYEEQFYTYVLKILAWFQMVAALASQFLPERL